MPGRQKNDGGATKLDAAAPPTSPIHEARPGAKNRPTPKRKDAQAARRQPLVPADRKAAKQADRERTRNSRAELRAAADRGEERALPQRDRGPEKRYIRDRVDTRRSIGEVAMPLMFIALLMTVMPSPAIKLAAFAIVWIVALIGFVDSFLLWRRVRAGLLAKFGALPPRAAAYTMMRSFQLRRARFPKPAVERGTKID